MFDKIIDSKEFLFEHWHIFFPRTQEQETLYQALLSGLDLFSKDTIEEFSERIYSSFIRMNDVHGYLSFEDTFLQNFRFDFDPWEKRKKFELQALSRFMDNSDNPDSVIFCVNEFSPQFYNDYQQFFGDQYVVIAYETETGQPLSERQVFQEDENKTPDGICTNAIIYAKTRFKKLFSRILWTSTKTPNIPSNSDEHISDDPSGISSFKHIVIAVLKDLITKKKFAIVNTHVTARSNGFVKHVSIIRGMLQNFVENHDNIPLILAGDLNTFTKEGVKSYLHMFANKESLDDMRRKTSVHLESGWINGNTYFGTKTDKYRGKLTDDGKLTQESRLGHIGVSDHFEVLCTGTDPSLVDPETKELLPWDDEKELECSEMFYHTSDHGKVFAILNIKE